MRYFFILVLISMSAGSYSQNPYKDSMDHYINTYVQNHEVVKDDDKKLFRFYPVDEQFRVTAQFEKVSDGRMLTMETSGSVKQVFMVYGILHFTIRDTAVKLSIYQSKDLLNIEGYKDYLFLPFTDRTSGEETYANGRYIDVRIPEITNNTLVIDFNKAYNPYCAYVSGRYSCPIPPRENDLPVAIRAGEQLFLKKH